MVLHVVVVSKGSQKTSCSGLTQVWMDCKNLLAYIQGHYFMFLDSIQSLFYLRILELTTKDRSIQLEFTQLSSLYVECHSLLLILSHNLMEDLSVDVKLASLLINELSGKESLSTLRPLSFTSL